MVLSTTTLLLAILSATPKAQEGSFGSARSFVQDLWIHYSELAHAFGRSAPLRISPGPDLARLVGQCEADVLISAKIEAGLIKKYNKLQVLRSLIDHPARLEFGRKNGSLLGTLGKTWIYPAPYENEAIEFVFKKTGGRGKAAVTFCRYSAAGEAEKIWTFEVDNGEQNTGQIWRRSFNASRNRMFSATVDGKSVTNRIDYEIQVRFPGQGSIRSAARNNLGPVSGFADLHAHHMSEFGFAGKWIWGSALGPLVACNGENHGKIPGTNTSWRGSHPHRTQASIDWPLHLDAMHQSMHATHLKRAVDGGLHLIVMPAVNNMWLAFMLDPTMATPVPIDDMDSVRLQLKAAHAFAARNPWYRIARDPWDARRIIQDGDLAVVLSVEVSNLLPDSHGNWEDQLDELYALGVRSMQITHETDSRFAGAAHHHGEMMAAMRALKEVGAGNFAAAVAEFQIAFPGAGSGGFAIAATPMNSTGLLGPGRQLLQELAKRKMVFEIDHCSRRARRDAYDFITSNAAGADLRNYPFCYTHARFDELMPSKAWMEANIGVEPKGAEGYDNHEDTGEYMPMRSEVALMQTLGGVFGIRTGPNAQLPAPGCPVDNRCHTSSRSIAQIVSMGQSMDIALALGSDLMGFVPQTGARFQGNSKWAILASGLPRLRPDDPRTDKPLGKPGALSEFDQFGLRHIGLEPDLVRDLENLGLNVSGIKNSAESFLRMWERCYQPNRQVLNRSQYKAMMGTP